MKTLAITIFILAIITNSCSNNQHDDTTLPAADSVKLADKIYTNQLLDLSAAKNINEILCQGWELEEDKDVIKNNNDAEAVYPYRSFHLFNDSTFTKNPRNTIEYGRWSLDNKNKTIIFNKSNGSRDQYKIAAIGANELVVVNSGQQSVAKLKFVSPGKRYVNNADDPYYIENNRWRIKPKVAENDSQIKKRLKDCLHFYILFYRDNLAKEEKFISFYGLPTCLKWYQGGIFLVKEKELANNWFECFYNRDQAMKAYGMMDKIISIKYKWSKEKMSWVKKNLLVLEQMYANL